MSRSDPSKQRLDTRVVHAGAAPDEATGAVIGPIYQTSTFAQAEPGKFKASDYSRWRNPSRDALEASLAALEGGRFALAFASGLAATQAVLQLLEPPCRAVFSDDVYGGTGRLCREFFARYDIDFVHVDLSDLDNLRRVYTPETRLIWVESPTNPMMKLVDISAVAGMVGDDDCLLAVDNTFASPVFQAPLELGADLVVHSTTKYIGGHSDFVGGAVVTSDERLGRRLHDVQFMTGSVPSPFECFLAQRSIKTLAVRMARHETNARAVAELLEGHSRVEKVLYPGLPSHPQHELAKRQMSGFSGMVSFVLEGSYDDVKAFFSRLRIFTLAESLGGVESLVNHPEKMTHASVPERDRERLGIGPNLVRLSVGIEDARDLVADLEQALS